VTLEDLKILISKGESETLEFKSSFNQETIVSLSAFTNTKGGVVILGVSDKKEISGVVINEETLQNWTNEIKTKTYPSILPDAEIFEIDNKVIVSLSVKEYPIKPVSVKGKYYKRKGNSNHQLSIQEISDLHLKTFNSSWDNYFTNSYDINNLSLEKINAFTDKLNKIRENNIVDDPLTVLHKFELIKVEKISNACFLLFSKDDVFQATIHAGRFSDSISIKDNKTIRCDLFGQIDEVLSFIKKHINKEYIITGNPQREERWQYPLQALREIVINMIVHRNYQDAGESIIKIYNDKIEFFNPGRLPDDISIEQLISGDYISQARNKKVASIFKDTGIIEQYGSGIRRIREIFIAYQLLPPQFENFQHGFKVTVFSKLEKVVEKVAEKVVEKVVEELSLNQQKIIDCIKSNHFISAKETAAIIGISLRKAQENFKKLKDKKIIKRIGPDKGGYWEVLK